MAGFAYLLGDTELAERHPRPAAELADKAQTRLQQIRAQRAAGDAPKRPRGGKVGAGRRGRRRKTA